MSDEIQHVSDTALWVAGCRALERRLGEAGWHDCVWGMRQDEIRTWFGPGKLQQDDYVFCDPSLREDRTVDDSTRWSALLASAQATLWSWDPREDPIYGSHTWKLAREPTTRIVMELDNSKRANGRATRHGENRSQTAAGPARDTFGRA